MELTIGMNGILALVRHFPTNLSSPLEPGFVPYFQSDHASVVEFWGVQCVQTQALVYEI